MISQTFPHVAVSELATTGLLAALNDGFTPPPALIEFAEEIKKSLGGGVQVKIYKSFTGAFGSSMQQKRGGLSGVGVVYYPEEVYVRGFITHCDLRKAPTDYTYKHYQQDGNAPTFNVHSPYISKNRLDSRDIARHTTKAKSLKMGVSNACKSLQVYDTDLVFSVTHERATKQQERSGAVLSQALDDAVKSVTGARYGAISARLSTELKHLHKTQHKFVDATYAGDVLTYIQAEQEVAEFRTHVNKCFYMVTVTERLKQPWFGVSHIPPSSTRSRSTLEARFAHGAKYENLIEEFKTLSEMPDTLMGKMSVLSVMPTDTYVGEVGMKINDNVYFLYGGDE